MLEHVHEPDGNPGKSLRIVKVSTLCSAREGSIITTPPMMPPRLSDEPFTVPRAPPESPTVPGRDPLDPGGDRTPKRSWRDSAKRPLPTAGAPLSPSPYPAMAGFKRGYDGKIAGLYDLDKTLGRGHFAVVKLARHVFTGEKVAVKVIDKTKLDTVATGHLFQEVRCMKLVQHPNIVRLYEVIDTQTKLYLILELGDGGDMFDYIMKHEEGLNEELAKKYFAQIVHAISYCHRLHVVHRDLKPENVVFFEKQGLVKLTDFGFSNKFQPGKKLTTSCGSLAYSAPEILLGDEYDAPAV
ncbi:hypothetical protein FQN60_017376, partial [Etheostoma spectabile]